MKAWELMYNEDVLYEAKSISDNVKIIENDGTEIIGEIDGFKVTTYIEYNSPTYASCNCSEIAPCKHEAALIYYLTKHPEFVLTEPDLKEKLDLIRESDLKKFLLAELNSNDELKSRFLKEFSSKPVNKTYYKNKLSKVFKTGEDSDFELHELYNLDMMESSLNDFLIKDINNLLIRREYDFACDLLIKIGDLLDDEMMSSYESWYDLSHSFMHYVHILSTSIYVDSEKIEKLNSKTDLITSRITIF